MKIAHLMNACIVLTAGAAAMLATDASPASTAPAYFDVARGAHPHDVAATPVAGGPVYYTAQSTGKLGILDPKSGKFEEIVLGARSSPHGVIVGPDGAAWITDGGQNAIVRVDPKSREVKVWPLPRDAGYANLNTATFDKSGRIWFTGQSGIYGRLDPASGDMRVWKAPRGSGPYGITTTPGGDVYFASLAGNYIARIDTTSGDATVIEPPTPAQGARRVWSDSRGRIWVSYWNTGQVGMYDPAARNWREWKLPGQRPSLCGLGRRQGQGLADRLEHQCDRSLRPGQRKIRQRAIRSVRGQCAPDAGPTGRSMGCRIGRWIVW